MINLRGVLNGTAISRIDHFYGEMVREHHGMANIARMNITRRSCGRLYGSTISQMMLAGALPEYDNNTASNHNIFYLSNYNRFV